MAKLITLTPVKTYATAANAVKAVDKEYSHAVTDHLSYIIQRTEEGRYFPVFIGERAAHAGVHFHFCVVN